MNESIVLNIVHPETGVRYQLAGDDARAFYLDEYYPRGFVLLDRDGGEPDMAATRVLVREESERRKGKATPADVKVDKAEKGDKGE